MQDIIKNLILLDFQSTNNQFVVNEYQAQVIIVFDY